MALTCEQLQLISDITNVSKSISIVERKQLNTRVKNLGVHKYNEFKNIVNASWGKIAENSLPRIEQWYFEGSISEIDLTIVRAIGLFRQAINTDKSTNPHAFDAHNKQITNWCYTIEPYSTDTKIKILAALMIKLPNDWSNSPWLCWEEAWEKEDNKTDFKSNWEMVYSIIFKTDHVMLNLCKIMTFNTIIESEPLNNQSQTLPDLWKPTI